MISNRLKTAPAGATAAARDTSLMRKGATGPRVQALQQALKAAGAFDGPTSPFFGSRTDAAVRAFQRKHGLVPDGIVGPLTRAKLAGFKAPAPAPAPTSSKPKPTPTGAKPKPTTGAKPKPTTGAKPKPAPTGAKPKPAQPKIGPVKVAIGTVQGRPTKVSLARIGDGELLKVNAAKAFLNMKAAAARAGIHIGVVDGFRSNGEQRQLYRLYRQGRGNLAARPGFSNHEGGIATDLAVGGQSTYRWVRRNGSRYRIGTTQTYRWLEANAARYGFKRTVVSEPWHWEYRGK